MENKIEAYKRNSVFTRLKNYCSFANEHDYIEVTEWKNGEGFDINISNSTNTKNFDLTHGEFNALKKLIKQLNKF